VLPLVVVKKSPQARCLLLRGLALIKWPVERSHGMWNEQIPMWEQAPHSAKTVKLFQREPLVCIAQMRWLVFDSLKIQIR
jgi:hypothetical protein